MIKKRIKNVKLVFLLEILPSYRVKFYERLIDFYPSLKILICNPKEQGKRFPEVFSKRLNIIKGSKAISCIWKSDVVLIDFFPSISSFFIFFIVKFLLRKIFIITTEEWWFPRTIKRLISFPIVKLILQLTDAIIVPGQASQRYFSEVYSVSPEKIFICHPASELDGSDEEVREAVQKIRTKLGLDRRKVVLFLGRMLKCKGVDYLIRAFKLLNEDFSNVVLILCGDGPEIENLKRLCEKLKVKDVIFVGWVSGTQKTAYLSLASVLVRPSIDDGIIRESWGLNINEAMLCGKPIVTTTAVGSAYDLVKNGLNGFIVRDKDVNALYVAIKRIISDEELERKMGNESKRIISEFTYEHMAIEFKKAIDTILTYAKWNCANNRR